MAAAPEGQTPLHDDHEVIANVWIRPVDALAQHRAGEFDMMFPTMRSLGPSRGSRRPTTLSPAPRRPSSGADDPAPHRRRPRWLAHRAAGDAGYDESSWSVLPDGIPMNKLTTGIASGGRTRMTAARMTDRCPWTHVDEAAAPAAKPLVPGRGPAL